MLQNLRNVYAAEPSRVIALTVAVLVFTLAKLGVLVDEQNVGEALALVLPILLGGELTRAKVTPDV